MKASSPSLRLSELTMALPCTHFSPASITSHLLESIMIGTREMSGSVAIRLRKCCMASTPSSMPSSMLMSLICAPLSTCCRATSNASVYWFSRIKRANLAEPVTLVRSPTLIKSESFLSFKGSSPAKVNSALKGAVISVVCVDEYVTGIGRGGTSLTTSTMALICAGVVPQQPPTILR